MADPRSHRGVPERWLLPPPPRDPHLAARWHDAGFDQRRCWARLGPDQLPAASDTDTEMAVGLAHARLATSWRLRAGGPVLGWLVLMTVWGFGRSTYPEQVSAWLVAGLVLGMIVGIASTVHAGRRLRRARALATGRSHRSAATHDTS